MFFLDMKTNTKQINFSSRHYMLNWNACSENTDITFKLTRDFLTPFDSKAGLGKYIYGLYTLQNLHSTSESPVSCSSFEFLL